MVEPTGHCPYLGLKQNQAIRFASPTPEHRCYAAGQAQEIPGFEPNYQTTYCLSPNHTRCPLYTGSGLPSTPVPPPPPRLEPALAPASGLRGWFAGLAPRDRAIYGLIVGMLGLILLFYAGAGVNLLRGGDLFNGGPPAPTSDPGQLPAALTPSLEPPTATASPAPSDTATGRPTGTPRPSPSATRTPRPSPSAAPSLSPSATPTAAPTVVFTDVPPTNTVPPPPPPPPPTRPPPPPPPTNTPSDLVPLPTDTPVPTVEPSATSELPAPTPSPEGSPTPVFPPGTPEPPTAEPTAEQPTAPAVDQTPSSTPEPARTGILP